MKIDFRFFDLKIDLEREMSRPNHFYKFKKFSSQNTPPGILTTLIISGEP